MQSHVTTPFGRRSLSLAMVASQTATQEFASRPEASETIVHKWRLFRALTEAKMPLGVTDRALSVLHALLSFHQETALALPENRDCPPEGHAASRIVVFPSNKELSIRAHGMAPRRCAGILPCWSRRADHPARLSQRQALCKKRAGRRDRGRLRLRSDAADRPRRRDREPRRGAPCREPCHRLCCGKRSLWFAATSSR